MGERVTTERARELVEAATPGPWRNNFNNTNPTIYGSWVDHDGLISADGNGIVWSLFTEADGVLSTHASVDNAAIIAAAPDLAADLLDARERIAALEAENAKLRDDFTAMRDRAARDGHIAGRGFVEAGMDTIEQLIGAVDAAREDASDARAEIARLTAAVTARAERAERERDELRDESAAYRAERDQMRRWAEAAAADENANAAELREVRRWFADARAAVNAGGAIDLDALGAILGGSRE